MYLRLEGTFYEKLDNYAINSSCTTCLVSSFSTTNFIKCFLNCQKNSQCLYVMHGNNECKLYNEQSVNYLVQTNGFLINRKYVLKYLKSN